MELEGADGKHVPPLQPCVPHPQAKKFPFAFIVAVVFALGSAVLVAVLWGRDYSTLAVLFGSLFGHTTSASVWSSLGTGYHWVRLVGSLAWLLLLDVALVVLLIRGSDLPASEPLIVIPGTMIVQFLFIQIPLWILRLATGCRLAMRKDVAVDVTERIRFGIGHVMAFTAIIGLVLGAGQALIRVLGQTVGFDGSDWAIFLYLAGAATLASLPTAAAILLDRARIIALLLAPVFVVIVAAFGHPLMRALGFGGGGPDMIHVATITVSAVIFVLIYSFGLRMFGYRLTVRKSEAKSVVNASPF